jgi:hypothetical protein
VEHTLPLSEKVEMYGDKMIELDDVIVRVVLQIVFEILVVDKGESLFGRFISNCSRISLGPTPAICFINV